MSAPNSHSVVLPAEPTPEMIQAWHDRHIEGANYIDRNSIEYALYVECYRAMLKAAPQSYGPLDRGRIVRHDPEIRWLSSEGLGGRPTVGDLLEEAERQIAEDPDFIWGEDERIKHHIPLLRKLLSAGAERVSLTPYGEALLRGSGATLDDGK